MTEVADALDLAYRANFLSKLVDSDDFSAVLGYRFKFAVFKLLVLHYVCHCRLIVLRCAWGSVPSLRIPCGVGISKYLVTCGDANALSSRTAENSAVGLKLFRL